MTKVKMKDLIQDDLSEIKTELIKNPEVFIQNLVGTLARTTKNPFSAYKFDLSLSYLKQVYERAFPSVKHGGPRISKVKESKECARESLSDQEELSSSWVKSVLLVDRAIIINLFKGIRHIREVPSFRELIEKRSEVSFRAIQKKIRAGNYIVNCTEAGRSIALFRRNKITHTEFLKFVIEEEKKKEKN